MAQGESLSGEMRRRGIAASTIREALGDWIVTERDRIVSKLATVGVSMEDLIGIQVDARAYMKLRNELERAMSQVNLGDLEEE